jgi:DNA-binding MarR family transcriptional regulator
MSPPPPATAAPEQLLLDALYHATRAMKGRIEAEMHEEGLTACQFWTLHQLRELGAVSTGRLASARAITPASVSVAVDGLVRGGFVRREPLARDRRVLLLVATPLGDRLLATIWERMARQFAGAVADLPERDLRAAARVLRRLQTPGAAGGRVEVPAA